MIHVTSDKITPLLQIAAKAGIPLELRGDPGSGKSSILRDFAASGAGGLLPLPLKVIDARPTQLEPPQLNGLDALDHENKRSTVYAPDWVPLEGDEIPEGYSGWLLIWEERPDADSDVQKALYKILMEREVADKRMHNKVIQMCAGNEVDTNCYAEEDSDAIKGRKIDIHLKSDLDAFMKICRRFNISSKITSYLQFRPANLNNYRALAAQATGQADGKFSSERGWFQVNQLIEKGGMDINDKSVMLPMVSGVVGTAIARDYCDFVEYYSLVPKIEDIVNFPDTLKVPTDPGIMYAMTGMIGEHADDTNIEQLMVFVNRMKISFAMVTVIEIVRHSPSLLESSPSLDKFIEKHSAIQERIAA